MHCQDSNEEFTVPIARTLDAMISQTNEPDIFILNEMDDDLIFGKDQKEQDASMIDVRMVFVTWNYSFEDTTVVRMMTIYLYLTLLSLHAMISMGAIMIS